MTRSRERRSASSAAAMALPFQARLDRDSTTRNPIEESIFLATERLLQTVPIADLRVEDVLSEAEVSRTTFYHYFKSKYAVVTTLLGEIQLEVIDVMQPWFARGSEAPEAALRASIDAVAEVWREHRSTFRATSENWHSVPDLGEPWIALMSRFIDNVADQIRHERKINAAPAGVDAHSLATTLTWSSERVLYLAGWGMLGKGEERAAVKPLLALWLGSIYGRSA